MLEDKYGIFALILVWLCLAIRPSEVKAEEVSIRELSSGWILKDINGTEVKKFIKIPTGVYSDLKDVYGDVLQSTNDINLRWIANQSWTYVQRFDYDAQDAARLVNLTLFGIDTVATVRLNGAEIGRTNNMFERYTYNVVQNLKRTNDLEIEIQSPIQKAKERAENLEAKNLPAPPNCPDESVKGICHRNMLRKVQASFGAEWSLAAPSMGIWKMVQLEFYDVAMLRDIDVSIRRNDTHWILDNTVYLQTSIGEAFYAECMFRIMELLEDPVNVTQRVSLDSLKLQFQVAIPMNAVTLWWPNGYGHQKLYALVFDLVFWLPHEGRSPLLKNECKRVLKVGFRSIEIVESDDDLGRSFYFSVNDHPIFVRGANFMPAHLLPEYAADTDRIKHLLQSAVEANMNMLRVYAGGMYESDYFYELADLYGLLIWQDMPFTKATYPITDNFVETISRETIQNTVRLGYHPSLALITTNNEIELYLTQNKSDFGIHSERLEEEYQQLFVGTIKFELDLLAGPKHGMRPGPLISTPSAGIKQSKKGIYPIPQNRNCGDIHFWEDERDAWNPDIYPQARFISEYGFQSLPSWSSWNHTLEEGESIARLIMHRQHDPRGFVPMDRLIKQHLPSAWLSNWEENIEPYIYLSQVAQAMAAKTATEVFRSNKENYTTMGALYFQWNDVWVAPTWSAIDYYGNYKLLYYWAKDFLAPTSIIALYDESQHRINVSFVRDDYAKDQNPTLYDVTINVHQWSSLYAKKSLTWQVILNSSSIERSIRSVDDIIVPPFTMDNSFLEFVLSKSDRVISSNFFFFPGSLPNPTGMRDPELQLEITSNACNENQDRQNISMSLQVTVRYPALFVYLEVVHPEIKQYIFSENGFVQVYPVRTIELQYGHPKQCLYVEPQHLRYHTVNKYALQTPGGRDGEAARGTAN